MTARQHRHPSGATLADWLEDAAVTMVFVSAAAIVAVIALLAIVL